MIEASQPFVLVDSATATVLAQVLPLLLLTLTVELRRTRLHARVSRGRLLAFFASFGVVETVLVLSIDGSLYPFQWFDMISAVLIFVLLGLLFALSMVEAPPPGIPPPAADEKHE